MTDPRILAARMANQKPVDTTDTPVSGTAGQGISGLDVAGAIAMGGADEGETLMVLAKWVQDKSAQARVFYIIYDRVVEAAVKKKWRVPKGQELLRKLTRVAIAEAIDPKCCPTCAGRRYVWMKGDTVARLCPTCNGMGKRGWRDEDRARLAEISLSSWSKRWGARYFIIIGIVSRFERAGLESLKRGMMDAIQW